VKSVFAMRLSDAERGQIAKAAATMELSLSGFIRRAALQAAAVTLGKVKVRPRVDPPAERSAVEPRAVVVADELEERAGHWVDGERVR
jgi:uncharacterized protein (DUF1778 family)